MKPKILVILGQTATGKSDVAVDLGKKFKGEIISADSRQIYRGLDIGTGKVTKKEMKGVSHYLLDVASPKKQFSVVDFQRLALKKINEIIKRKKIPIIAGGTGFYIDAIVKENSFPEVPPDHALRKKLATKSAITNLATLKKLDSRRAKNIDPKNNIRIIRAIEIARALGKVPHLDTPRPSKYDSLKIGLKPHQEILKAKIKYRLLKRLDMGMIEEVKKLHKKRLSWKRLNELGLEYRYVALYLQKKISREEMIDELSRAIWRYAKRQDTWFKRDKNIRWFDPSKKSDLREIGNLVEKFLK